MSAGPQAYFESRFAHDPRRETLWRVLYANHFSRLISAEDCVLELGAGYGHFTIKSCPAKGSQWINGEDLPVT